MTKVYDPDKAQEEAIKENKRFDQMQKIKGFFSFFSKKNKSPNPGYPQGPYFGYPNPGSAKKESLIAFVFAILNYVYLLVTGFQFNTWRWVADIITIFFIAYYLGGLMSFILFVLLIPVPYVMILTGISPVIAYLITHWPVILIFLAIRKIQVDPQSWLSRLALLAIIVLVLFILFPMISDASIPLNYAKSQADVVQAKLGTMFEKSSEAVSNQIELNRCMLSGKTKLQCQQEQIRKEELLNQIDVAKSGITDFEIYIKSLQEQQIVRNFKAVSFYARNGLTKKVTLNFFCGLEEKGPATPSPATFDVNPGTVSTLTAFSCKDLNFTKKGTAIFYANITAKGLSSSGYKRFLTTGKSTAERVKMYSVGSTVSENEAWLASEFGDYLKLIKSSLKPVVGEKDLIQPVLQEGDLAYGGVNAPLVQGIKQGTEIPLIIFLKNNGKGRVMEVTNVIVTPPSGFDLNPANCGITQDSLKRINWRKIVPGDETATPPVIGDCYLVAKETPKYPNNINEKIISINIDYDYIVSTTQEIIIPEPYTT